MDKSELNRREFQRLTGAALGGMLLGAGALKSSLLAAPAADSNPLLGDNHVCRGLNTCKAKGADKKNSCAEPVPAPSPRSTPATRPMIARDKGAAAPIPAKTPARAWASAACL